MTTSQSVNLPTSSKIKLIYNPNAGHKRKLAFKGQHLTLEDITDYFLQYQLVVDYFPTKGPGHATELAQDAVKEGYKIVVGAGGDGTISEVANGLINTNVTLGILPLGTFMNTARMLAIPNEIEKAIQIIKIGRTRKIDVGSITKFSGEDLSKPFYFLESAGIGLEAQFHYHFRELERGHYRHIWELIKLPFEYWGYPATVTLDDRLVKTRATLITISNGPFTGAALPIAPTAKLNDHVLTVSFYRMSPIQLAWYFARKIGLTSKRSSKIAVHQAKKVRIETKVNRLVHADATVYGQTPVEFEIQASAINVITGFPKSTDNALKKRTLLDP